MVDLELSRKSPTKPTLSVRQHQATNSPPTLASAWQQVGAALRPLIAGEAVSYLEGA